MAISVSQVIHSDSLSPIWISLFDILRQLFILSYFLLRIFNGEQINFDECLQEQDRLHFCVFLFCMLCSFQERG